MTFIPNAWAILAVRVPSLPRPRTPKVRPSRSMPILVCPAKVRVEDLDIEVTGNLRPVGRLEGDILIVVEDRAAGAGHDRISVGWPGETREDAGGNVPL